MYAAAGPVDNFDDRHSWQVDARNVARHPAGVYPSLRPAGHLAQYRNQEVRYELV
jgi:hypothetical protein